MLRHAESDLTPTSLTDNVTLTGSLLSRIMFVMLI